MNIEVENRLEYSVFRLSAFFRLNVLKFVIEIYNDGQIRWGGLMLQVESKVVEGAIAFDDDIEQDIGR